MSPNEQELAAVRTAFLTRLLEDQEAGAVRSLDEYRAQFPGFEDVVDQEYARIHATDPDGEQPDVPQDVDARYRRIAELGRGGMGVVLRVWDRELGRSCAMKILDHDADPRAAARFHEEARVGAQLAHPGIVPVLDAGTDGGGRSWFTMPIVLGRPFSEVIELIHGGAEGWSITRGIEVVRQACEAVAYANNAGIVHRDLKAANVMVGPFGEVLVLDWGVARRLDADPTTAGDAPDATHTDPLATLPGDVVGTPSCMAPEQARGEVGAIDQRTDVYALGAMLYHLLAGQTPYAGQRDSSSVLERVVAGPPRSVRAVGRGVPPELAAICERAMARDVEARYPDARTMAEDLRAFLEVRVVSAHRTGAWIALRKWVARNRALAAAAAVAVLSLAIGLAVAVHNARQADAEAERAEANFRVAFRAVEDLLTEVSQETLVDVPAMDSVRRSLLEKALAYYQEFLADGRAQPKLQEEVLRAHYRVGVVNDALGDLDAAEAAWQEALHGADALLETNPGVGPLELRAMARQRLANAWAQTGRPEEALAAQRRVAAEAEELIQRQPDAPRHRTLRIGALSNSAMLLARLGRTAEAADVACRVVELSTALTEEEPEHRVRLVHHCTLAGTRLHRAGRRKEAQPMLLRAVRLGQRALADEPDSREAREMLAAACNNAGALLRGPGGHRLVELAIERRRELVATHPESPHYRHQLGASLSNLARSYLTRDEPQAARRAAREAIDQQRAALAVMPDFLVAHGSLRRHYGHLREALRRLGDHEALAHCADEQSSMLPHGAREAISAAFGFAACIPLVTDDTGVDAARRAELQESYARRAVACVRAAIQRGLSDPAVLDRPELDPVRTRDDFAALVAEFDPTPGDGAGR